MHFAGECVATASIYHLKHRRDRHAPSPASAAYLHNTRGTNGEAATTTVAAARERPGGTTSPRRSRNRRVAKCLSYDCNCVCDVS